MLAEPDDPDGIRGYRFDAIIFVYLDDERGFLRYEKYVCNEG